MSERSFWPVDKVYEVELEVFDSASAVVTGLVDGDFAKTLLKDGASSAQVVTVTEIAGGRYKASYTPNGNGRWHLHVTHATHNKRGWTDDLEVNVVGREVQVAASSVNDAGATTTVFITALTEAVNDFWKDAILIFTSGALRGQTRRVTAYNGTTKAVTVDAATAAPANAVTFVLLGVGSGGGATAAAVADAVWDEARADHVAAGSFGQGAASVQGNVTGSVGSVAAGGIAAAAFAAGAVDAAAIATDAIGAAELSQAAADKVWASATRALTDKVGFALTTLESVVQHSGTAQAGAATTITLAAGASATTDLYVGQVVKLYGGTGAGQARVVTASNGATKVATVDRAWTTIPDATSTYAVLATSGPKVNATLQAEASTVAAVGAGAIAATSFAAGAIDAAAVGTGAIDADAIAADAITAAKIANGAIDAATFAAGAIDAAAIATDAIGAAELAQAAADKVWATTVRALTDKAGFGLAAGAITAPTFGAGAIDAAAIAAGAIDADALAADAVQEVWDKATAALTVAGSVGKLLVDNVNATVASRAAPGDAMGLSNGAITAAKFAANAVDAAALATDAANEIADALLNRAAAIDGFTPKQVLALVMAAVLAKCSGEPNNPVTVRSADDLANRIVYSVDADGNRTAVTLTPP